MMDLAIVLVLTIIPLYVFLLGGEPNRTSDIPDEIRKQIMDDMKKRKK